MSIPISMQECILQVMKVLTTGELTTPAAKVNIETTFVKVGNVPTDNGTFTTFKYEPSGGTVKIAPTGTMVKYTLSQDDLDYQPPIDDSAELPEDGVMSMDILDIWSFDDTEDFDFDFESDVFDNSFIIFLSLFFKIRLTRNP